MGLSKSQPTFPGAELRCLHSFPGTLCAERDVGREAERERQGHPLLLGCSVYRSSCCKSQGKAFEQGEALLRHF